MQTFKCDLCHKDLPLEIAVGHNTKNGITNYKQRNVRERGRCKPCNTEQARKWRKRNPSYRGSGKIKNIPEEDRLLASAISMRLTDARQRAKKRSMKCDVDRTYLYELFKSQSGKCALSGVDLKIEKGAIACLSLDQIDPTKGYIRGNVQWVAWAVNRAKGDMPLEVFTDMCQKVIDYRKVQRLSNDTTK